MKKLHRAAALVMTALVLTGCGAGQISGASAPGGAAISNEQLEIGEYKGLVIQNYQGEEITDEVVQENLDYIVNMSSERISVTDRAAESGDDVVLQVAASIDGFPYENLSYTDIQVTIPDSADVSMESDDLLDMVALQASGYRAGDSYSFDSAIPNTYSVFPEIAGKTVHWEVTITEIVQYKAAELNDAFVANQEIEGVETVDDYREYIRQSLIDYSEQTSRYTLQDEALAALLAQVTLKEYPQEAIDSYIDEYRTSYEENAENLHVTYEEYLQDYMGISVEEFESQILSTAEQYVTEDLAIEAIAEAEGLEMTDEIYADEIDDFASLYGFESGAQMEETYGRESLAASMQREKVLQFLVDHAELTDEEVTYDAPASAETEQTGQTQEIGSAGGNLLYVTIALAIVLLAVIAILVIVLLKGRKR